jgi:cellulose synthase/poly-beta-1,6-N-acetylglucosamine synthase-like glycosyltransferase
MTLPELIFLLAAATLVYIIAGYPIILDFLAHRHSHPVNKQPQRKSVSILVPVRNGEPWLRAKMETLAALNYPQELIEIILVSDASTDGTDRLAQEYISPRIHFMRLPVASGKAVALNLALEKARGEILFFTDVRQTLDPMALQHLVDSLADPKVGVVSGELVIRKGETREEAATGAYWLYEKWVRDRQSQIDSLPGATGSIYAMRRELARPLPADTLLDDVHQPLNAFFGGYRLVLDRKAKAYDDPTSLETEFRRKVRTQAGVYQVILRFPGLLGPQNRIWFHFVSHKLGRLLMPYYLIALAITTPFLPAPWARVAFGVQAGFYTLALMDLIIPPDATVRRITSQIRAFVVLTAAAFCATSIFFVPAGKLWRPTPARVAQS